MYQRKGTTWARTADKVAPGDLPVFVIPECGSGFQTLAQQYSQFTDSAYFGLGQDMINNLNTCASNPTLKVTPFAPRRLSHTYSDRYSSHDVTCDCVRYYVSPRVAGWQLHFVLQTSLASRSHPAYISITLNSSPLSKKRVASNDNPNCAH